MRVDLGGSWTKDVALQIGIETAEILNRSFQVHVTRNSDKNLSLKDRAKVTLNRKAAAFVSIHLNGSANPEVQGTET
jgi:N-acetylmuramoyl-L-alanine amidase